MAKLLTAHCRPPIGTFNKVVVLLCFFLFFFHLPKDVLAKREVLYTQENVLTL